MFYSMYEPFVSEHNWPKLIASAYSEHCLCSELTHKELLGSDAFDKMLFSTKRPPERFDNLEYLHSEYASQDNMSLHAKHPSVFVIIFAAYEKYLSLTDPLVLVSFLAHCSNPFRTADIYTADTTKRKIFPDSITDSWLNDSKCLSQTQTLLHTAHTSFSHI